MGTMFIARLNKRDGKGGDWYAYTTLEDHRFKFIGPNLEEQKFNIKLLADYMAQGQQATLTGIRECLHLDGLTQEEVCKLLYPCSTILQYEGQVTPIYECTPEEVDLWEVLVDVGEALLAAL